MQLSYSGVQVRRYVQNRKDPKCENDTSKIKKLSDFHKYLLESERSLNTSMHIAKSLEKSLQFQKRGFSVQTTKGTLSSGTLSSGKLSQEKLSSEKFSPGKLSSEKFCSVSSVSSVSSGANDSLVIISGKDDKSRSDSEYGRGLLEYYDCGKIATIISNTMQQQKVIPSNSNIAYSNLSELSFNALNYNYQKDFNLNFAKNQEKNNLVGIPKQFDSSNSPLHIDMQGQNLTSQAPCNISWGVPGTGKSASGPVPQSKGSIILSSGKDLGEMAQRNSQLGQKQDAIMLVAKRMPINLSSSPESSLRGKNANSNSRQSNHPPCPLLDSVIGNIQYPSKMFSKPKLFSLSNNEYSPQGGIHPSFQVNGGVKGVQIPEEKQQQKFANSSQLQQQHLVKRDQNNTQQPQYFMANSTSSSQPFGSVRQPQIQIGGSSKSSSKLPLGTQINGFVQVDDKKPLYLQQQQMDKVPRTMGILIRPQDTLSSIQLQPHQQVDSIVNAFAKFNHEQSSGQINNMTSLQLTSMVGQHENHRRILSRTSNVDEKINLFLENDFQEQSKIMEAQHLQRFGEAIQEARPEMIAESPSELIKVRRESIGRVVRKEQCNQTERPKGTGGVAQNIYYANQQLMKSAIEFSSLKNVNKVNNASTLRIAPSGISERTASCTNSSRNIYHPSTDILTAVVASITPVSSKAGQSGRGGIAGSSTNIHKNKFDCLDFAMKKNKHFIGASDNNTSTLRNLLKDQSMPNCDQINQVPSILPCLMTQQGFQNVKQVTQQIFLKEGVNTDIVLGINSVVPLKSSPPPPPPPFTRKKISPSSSHQMRRVKGQFQIACKRNYPKGEEFLFSEEGEVIQSQIQPNTKVGTQDQPQIQEYPEDGNTSRRLIQLQQIPQQSNSQQPQTQKLQPSPDLLCDLTIHNQENQKRQLLRLNPYKLRYLELQQKILAQDQVINNAVGGIGVPSNMASFTPPQTAFRYYVGYGNNSEMIKRLMKGRDWWSEYNSEIHQGGFNFRWTQSTQGIRFDKLNVPLSGPRVSAVNHFEEHREISQKDLLIKNLKLFCETNKIALFSITPVTFIIDLNDDACELSATKFAKFFCRYHPALPDSSKKLVAEFKKNLKPLFSSVNSNYKKIQSNIYSKPQMQPTFLNTTEGAYIWLLKTTIYNRGRGIELFSTFEQLEKCMKEYADGIFDRNLHLAEEKEKCKNVSEVNDSTSLRQEASLRELPQSTPGKEKKEGSDIKEGKQQLAGVKNWQILRSQTFVIQKYIERPMLIKGRKFDMRVFVLVTHTMECYFYKCGYIRTASQAYQMGNLDNQFIHLTNNAVQKYAKNYGEFEQGNILSLEQFDALVKENHDLEGCNLYGRILPHIREVCLMTLASIKKKLSSQDRHNCFEMFGYDFFIDEDFKVWLIEVNSNPSIEESNDYLRQLMPRLVDDTFKLTIDQIFPRPGTVSAPKQAPLVPKIILKKGQIYDSNTNLQSHGSIQLPTKKQESSNSPHHSNTDQQHIHRDSTLDPPESNLSPSFPLPLPPKKREKYPIDGHNDDDNLWQSMANLSKFNYANYTFQTLNTLQPGAYHPLKDILGNPTIKQSHSKRNRDK